MGLGRTFARWLVSKAAADDAAPRPASIGMLVGDLFGSTATTGPTSVSANAALAYEINAWVHTCASRVAGTIAEVPWVVEKRLPDGTWEPAPTHPLQTLIDEVNSRADAFMLKESTSTWLQLHGNSYWLIGRASKTGPPMRLFQLPADKMTVNQIPAPPFVAGYSYKPDSDKPAIPYPVEDIIHSKLFNPRDPFFGMGVVTAIESEINQFTALNQFNSGFLANGGVPVGIIKADDELSEDQKQRLSSWWNRVTGKGSGGKPPIVGKDMEFVEIGSKVDDVVVTAMPRYLREVICSAFGTPPATVGLFEYANYANVVEQERMLWVHTARPMVNRILAAMNEQLVPQFDDGKDLRIIGDFTGIEALQPDRAIGLQELTAGVLLGNEYRETYLHRESTDWGDNWYGPFSTGVIAGPGAAEVDSFEAPADDTPEGQELSAGATRAKRKGIRRLGAEARIKAAQNFDNQRDSEERRMQRAIAPAWDDMTEVMIEKIEANRDALDPQGVRIPDPNEMLFPSALAAETLRELIEPALWHAYELGGVTALDNAGLLVPETDDPRREGETRSRKGRKAGEGFPVGAGISFDIQNPRALALLKQRLDMMTSVGDTMQVAARLALDTGIAEGETIKRLTDRVKRFAKDGKEKHALTVARTETGTVMNQAAQEAYAQAGASQEWLAVLDENTRHNHADMDGQIAKAGEQFDFETVDGGSIMVDGPFDSAMDIGDIANCRCTTVPVFED